MFKVSSPASSAEETEPAGNSHPYAGVFYRDLEVLNFTLDVPCADMMQKMVDVSQEHLTA